jgi:hypothetical protein
MDRGAAAGTKGVEVGAAREQPRDRAVRGLVGEGLQQRAIAAVRAVDLHATIHCALGINPAEEVYTSDNRPAPITDGGSPVRELFA